MSEEKVDEKPLREAVDVFIHSKTGLPDAWTEEEIQSLLDLWEDVLSRPRSRRYSVSKRIYKRLLNKQGFRKVNKEDVAQQMSTLHTEYTTFLGLQIIGKETVRPSYVDQLERIFSRAPRPVRQNGRRPRRNTEPTEQSKISEDSDHSRSHSITYGEKDAKIESNSTKGDETLSSTRRGRFPRMNVQKLIRTMVSQQNAMMDQVQKLFSSLDVSNSKTAALLEDLVSLKKKQYSSISEQAGDSTIEVESKNL